jgi:hypothetical protein
MLACNMTRASDLADLAGGRQGLNAPIAGKATSSKSNIA